MIGARATRDRARSARARYVVSVSPHGKPDGWLRLQGRGAPVVVADWLKATWFTEDNARAWASIVQDGAMVLATEGVPA